MATSSSPVDYRVFDADNHYYEPIDMFERYIDPQFRDRTFTTAERDGDTVVLFQRSSLRLRRRQWQPAPHPARFSTGPAARAGR
jgi:hypothetical protein